MKNLEEIYNYLSEKKCKDIAVYDLSKESQDYDYIFVVTTPSTMANKKFAFSLTSDLQMEDLPEGYNKGEWIIFDLGQILIHSFIPQAREKYNLDKLWKGKKIEFVKN